MKSCAVFDIGGTSFRSAVYKHDRKLHQIKKKDSPNFIKYPNASINELQEMLVEDICRTVELYSKVEDIQNIGVSFPGPINNAGYVLQAPTLWGEQGKPYPLLDLLSQRIKDCKIYLLNDITAAGYRYINFNNGTFCIITVSSGVGNKVFWEKQVLLNDGLGGELGHSYVSGPFKCDCGSQGHLGGISSGRGIEKLAIKLSIEHPYFFKTSSLFEKEITSFSLANAIKIDDEFSIYVLEESLKPLAQTLCTLITAIGINYFIVIGGFPTAIGQKYIENLKKLVSELKPFGVKPGEIDRMISLGENDDYHGLIGIGEFIFNKLLQKSGSKAF